MISPRQRQHYRLFFSLWLTGLLLSAPALADPLAAFASPMPTTATAEPLSPLPVPRRVLVLNSYHLGMRFSDDEVQGIRSTLPQGTEIFLEYMDAKRVQGDSYTAQLATLYAMKYGSARFVPSFPWMMMPCVFCSNMAAASLATPRWSSAESMHCAPACSITNPI